MTGTPHGKFRRLEFCLLALMPAFLVACSKPAASSGAEAEAQKVTLYKEGKGVVLPEDIKQRFNVKLAEAIETNVSTRVERTIEVYQAATESGPALGIALFAPSEAEGLQPGQAVAIESADGTELSGRIVKIDRGTQDVLGRVEAVVQFADVKERFPVGTFASATFAGKAEGTVLVVPSSSVLDAADGEFAYVVNGKYFTRTKIKTREAANGMVAVMDGLYAGDVVVANGIDELRLIELQATKMGQPCCVVPKK